MNIEVDSPSRRTGSRPRAFTLVELLVVIGIIALLISILLPALGRARRAANTVVCAANLRSVLQGMQLYVTQYKGAIPGGAWTSSAHLFKAVSPAYGASNCPGVIQATDWQSPIAKVLHVSFDEGSSSSSRIRRFKALNQLGIFNCPENSFLAGPYGVVTAPGTPEDFYWPVATMNAYVSPLIFHLKADAPQNAVPNGRVAVSVCDVYWQVPNSYAPKITKIGEAARKIFIADGARYSRPDTAPDYDTSPFGDHGGTYADQGAFASHSNAWARGMAPGQDGAYTSGNSDSRLYAFRHGSRRSFLPGDNYKLNAGFYDGHVESMGDLEVCNPTFWAPRGTLVSLTPGQIYPDVAKRFSLPSGGTMLVP